MNINFRKKVAIDLGTSSILVYTRSAGVVFKEPTVVAIDRFTDKILAVGEEAKQMIGRTPGNIRAIKPLKDGVIVDYKSTEIMLKTFLQRAIGRSLIRPDIIICVPTGATQVQKRAVIQAGTKAGANRVYLIEEPIAAAIGAGINISEAGGNMVIDVGGGTTDIAVISVGKIVVSESIKVAGDSFDKAIVDYMRRNYNIIIGEKTAEAIKLSLASREAKLETKYKAKGRNLYNGLPDEAELTVADIERAISGELSKIVDGAHRVLSNTPPELSADLYDRGIVLTGGGALLRSLAEKVTKKTGLRVKIDENPITAVVIGAGKSLNWMNKIESIEDNQYEFSRKIMARNEKLRRR